MNFFVWPIFRVPTCGEDIICMLENNIWQIQNSNFLQHGKQIKNIVDVVVDTVAHIFTGTNAVGEFAIGPREKRKRTKLLFKDFIVEVHQNNPIGKCLKGGQNLFIPTASSDDYIVI